MFAKTKAIVLESPVVPSADVDLLRIPDGIRQLNGLRLRSWQTVSRDSETRMAFSVVGEKIYSIKALDQEALQDQDSDIIPKERKDEPEVQRRLYYNIVNLHLADAKKKDSPVESFIFFVFFLRGYQAACYLDQL